MQINPNVGITVTDWLPFIVPAALVESYKTATNWAAYWGYGNNKFLALEDYTVDGTVTGEIDWDRLNAV